MNGNNSDRIPTVMGTEHLRFQVVSSAEADELRVEGWNVIWRDPSELTEREINRFHELELADEASLRTKRNEES